MGQQHRVFDRVDVETRRGETGFARRFDLQEVVKLDRLEGGAQLVETVAVAADDLEVEVELGSRGQREGQFTPRRGGCAEAWSRPSRPGPPARRRSLRAARSGRRWRCARSLSAGFPRSG